MGVGCFSFGDFVEAKAAETVVHYALGLGINYFDTADSYGIGVSEEKLGVVVLTNGPRTSLPEARAGRARRLRRVRRFPK